MAYHFDAPQDGDARRIIHPLWGGEVTLEAGTRISFSEGLAEPVNIVRALCTGAGGYRRSASAVRRHERSYHVLTFIDRGRVSYSPSHETFVLDPGFFTIIKNTTGYVAKFLPDGEDRVETYTLRIPDHLIAPYLPKGVVFGRPLPVTDGHGPGAMALVKLLFEHGQGLPRATLEKLLAAFFELVASLVEAATAYPPPRLRADQRHFRSIEHFIEQNIASTNLSMKRVAAELNVSTRYVSAIFSAQDVGFRTYLKQRRLALARHLLETLDPATYSIAEIAALSGFSTASQFATTFRTSMGCSPGEYRAAAR